MSYTPKFTDPRVKRAGIKAITWVNNYLSVNNPHWLSSREIDKHLTDNSRPLGRWLRSKLLICVNSYFDPLKAICKTYKLNLSGYQEVCQLLDYQPKFTPSAVIQQQVESGNFEYTEIKDRLFTPTQFIPKQKRNAYLYNHGYVFHYDIEAASAALLVQRAYQVQQSRLLNDSNYKTLTLPYLDAYINDRDTYRKEIAQACGCSPSQVKTLVNSLLNGGKLSSWANNKTFEDLNRDYTILKNLIHNETLKLIRDDITSLWVILRDEFPVRYMTMANGRQRRRALSSGDKSGYYRSLENQVGDVIRRYLKKDKNKHLWIHDGWCCQRIVDDVELISEVRRQTGFVIKLSKEIFDNSCSSYNS